VVDAITTSIAERWGQGTMLDLLAPSVAQDPRFVETWRRYERSSATPNAAAALFCSIIEIDIRGILDSVEAPVLVVQRRDARLVPASGARWLADHLPTARYVELPGEDTLPYVGNRDEVLDVIQEFVTGSPGRGPHDRVLATVLFTDIVGSTRLADELGDEAWRDLLDAHHTAVRRTIARFDGVERNTMGDGFLVTFDGPARAVRCAPAASEAAQPLGLRIRARLHTGEVELRGDPLSGMAVHVGARVCALAGPDEVLVTAVVKDLVLGSGIEFEPAGVHTLKGVPGEWALHRVVG
jgi:class 3 adenylate cyclase